NKQYLLTTAVGGFPQFVDNADMKKSAHYLDYVNLMTYDYHPKDLISHHTNLFPSSDFEKENSADKAVKTFIKAGVPAHKLVVGMAFYGRSWFLDSSTAPVLKRKALKQVRGGGYSFLKDSVAGKNGFTEHWDEKASAPYLYNDSTRQFITYDNERSVKEKCRYVKKNKLGGVMFWEYNSDPKLYLLTTAHENLDHQ
ncbi:MAG: glycosyl hydrolase family 18 protein, partial [Flavitalea sp.]